MASETSAEWGEKVDEKWIEIQKKTFTRWANTYLKERMLKLDDLALDLADGTNLINLLEIISSKSLGKYTQKPKLRAQMLENNLFALKFLQKEGIKLVNIGNEDIVDCKLKLILGLIWTIILRYQIHIEEGKSARNDLLKWVQKQIPEYGIVNFTKDWNDGKAICALGNSLMPGICPNHMQLNPADALKNAVLGTDLAQSELDIPKVLAPEDMIDTNVDELSVMTYISFFRDWEANQLKKLALDELEKIAVPEKCRAFGPGFEGAETGIPTEFQIEAINSNGRRVNHGGDPFEVVITGPNNASIPIQVEDHQDGLYTVKYTATDAGKHRINVGLKSKQISNCPREIRVLRGGADPNKCRAYGPGLEAATVGEVAPFTIEANNRNGEKLKDGGDAFDVQVEGPYGKIPAKISDKRDGTYGVEYVPLDFGNHTVSISLLGTPIPNSPFKVPVGLSLQEADWNETIAYGPGLEGGYSGNPGIFTIETRNSKGSKLKDGGQPVGVDVTGPNGMEIPAKITDKKDGTYEVEYTPVDPGKHTVDIYIRNKNRPLYYNHIKQSPVTVNVAAGTDAGQSIAYGPGLKDGIPDNLPADFKIEARDRNGKPMGRGGDLFDVKIEGPTGKVPATVKDNGDGTYDVQYQPQEPGKHKVTVELKNTPIKDAPFNLNVKEAADSDHSCIEGFSFVIQAKTKKNGNRKDGGDNFQVEIKGPKGNVPDVNVKDVNDGTYHVNYKLNQGKGDYNVSVKLNGKDISGSPWKQHV